MSFRLVNPLGSYAPTKEIMELTKGIAEFDGIVMARMRDKGNHLFDSIEETGKVARQSKTRLNNSSF